MYRSLQAAVRDAEAKGISLSQLALETESDDQGRPVGEIRDVLKRALIVMQGAVTRGLAAKSPSGLSTRIPRERMAARCAPRAMRVTSSPARARHAPT